MYGYADESETFGKAGLTQAQQQKYSVLHRLYDRILDLGKRYDLELLITDDTCGPGRLWEDTGNWVITNYKPPERSAKIVFASKAVNALSDLAFEGLICRESTRAFLFHFASKNSRAALRLMMMPWVAQEVHVDERLKLYFETEGLVPYRSETGNIDYRERESGKIVEFFADYLKRLRKVLPEEAAEILEKLEFKNELGIEL
jgi:hypothetical protein